MGIAKREEDTFAVSCYSRPFLQLFVATTDRVRSA